LGFFLYLQANRDKRLPHISKKIKKSTLDIIL